MHKLTASLHDSGRAEIPEAYCLADLRKAVSDWLLSGSVEGWSPRTLTERRWWMDRFADYLAYEELDFSTDGIRRFLYALAQGQERRCKGPLKPGSVATAHRILRAFSSWLVEEERLPEHPMRRIPPPINRDDRARPLEPQEVQKLLDAARKTRNGKRDSAILAVLLDTGLRASELCALRMQDLDLLNRRLEVRCGKGGKSRQAPLGKSAVKTLWDYLKHEERDPQDYAFLTERGDSMSRNSLRLLMDRLQRETGVHTYAHRFRHTAAVFMLRNGASAYHVMRFLGHTTLHTTQRYAKLAESDVLAIHRETSPLDNLRSAKKVA